MTTTKNKKNNRKFNNTPHCCILCYALGHSMQHVHIHSNKRSEALWMENARNMIPGRPLEWKCYVREHEQLCWYWLMWQTHTHTPIHIALYVQCYYVCRKKKNPKWGNSNHNNNTNGKEKEKKKRKMHFLLSLFCRWLNCLPSRMKEWHKIFASKSDGIELKLQCGTDE